MKDFEVKIQRKSVMIALRLDHYVDPRTGKRWRSKKQVREFLDSLGE
jgi:hypothetical protein